MRNRLTTSKPLRQVVAVAIIAAGMAGISATARADDMLRVGKSVPEPFSFTPLDIGMQKGFFKKHGLDIQETAFGGDAKLQQAMAADSIDVGIGSGPAMAFIAKGSPVKAIAAMAGPPLLLAIVVRPDGPKTAADLKGKKVSVSTAGSLTYFLVSETSRSQGWGPNGIDIEPMGAMPGQIAALKRGDIDGIIMDVGNAFELEKKGEGRILVRFTQMKDFMIHVIYATDKDIASKPDDLRNFLKAHEVTRDNLPPELVSQWMTPDGKARIEVVPSGNTDDNATLRTFAQAVLGVEPNATEGRLLSKKLADERSVGRNGD